MKKEMIKDQMKKLSGWQPMFDQTAIYKTFSFKSFSEAWGFATSIALLAEKNDHHPDLAISYNTVTVTLTTHAAKAVTEKDISMAYVIDKLS